jgi:hypothetical protein
MRRMILQSMIVKGCRNSCCGTPPPPAKRAGDEQGWGVRATDRKNCSRSKTACGSTNTYVAFVLDESFCFGGILTTSNNVLSKLALEPWHSSIP